jgi:SAM-dependent methyltransferase
MIATVTHAPERLTTPTYWDGYLRRFRLPRRNDERTMPWRALDQALAPYLDATPGRMLEVGCAASAWLPYFARRGYHCFGLDYSAMGCRMAAVNLAHYGAAGDLWCADVDAPAVAPGRFDVVFSNGFVEHFTDTARILRRLGALARPGGLVVTLVPNLAGWAGRGFAIANPGAFAAHVVIRPDELAAAHQHAGLHPLEIAYRGVWFPFLWSARPAGSSRAVSFAIKCLVHGTARPAWALSALTGRYPESRAASPYVLAIARRPRD